MILLCVVLQYCNGGDLADYLQGKHCSNLKHAPRRFIMIKLLVLQERWRRVTGPGMAAYRCVLTPKILFCTCVDEWLGLLCFQRGQRALTVQSLLFSPCELLGTALHGVAFRFCYNRSRGTSLKACLPLPVITERMLATFLRVYSVTDGLINCYLNSLYSFE